MACMGQKNIMKKRCMRPGRKTNNGYLNYLRVFRIRNCGLTAREVISAGAKSWNGLSAEEKQKYNLMGPKSAQRSNRRRKSKRCLKPGPLTNNGYLNYLRYFRKHNCGLSQQQIVKKGAKRWCSLTKEQRMRFERQACQKASKHRQNRGICRKC